MPSERPSSSIRIQNVEYIKKWNKEHKEERSVYSHRYYMKNRSPETLARLESWLYKRILKEQGRLTSVY